jgi:hypothetical protein
LVKITFPFSGAFPLRSPLLVSFFRPHESASQGAFVVPSEDYSHEPPCCAAFFVEGRKTETEQAEHKKNTMKTKLKNQKSEAQNRPEQSGTDKRAKINTARREANRALNTDKLLALLRSEAPKFFELAEIVGKWVWIQFDQKQPVTVTSVLSELGFHWNGKRQSWQHPCGIFRDQSSPIDPRKKYGSRFAADVNPA